MKIKIFSLLLLSNLLFSHEVPMDSSFEKLTEIRHSGRTFDTHKRVTEEQLKQLAIAAKNSPSCYNDQPWNFIFFDKEKDPEGYQKVMSSLVEFNQGWAKAPVLIVIVADTQFRHNQKNNRFGQYDTGAAAMSLVYQATDLGLMAHQMGGFDEKKVQKDFNIPPRYIPMSVMALGYEAENASDVKPRERRPMNENFFKGAWGKPF